MGKIVAMDEVLTREEIEAHLCGIVTELPVTRVSGLNDPLSRRINALSEEHRRAVLVTYDTLIAHNAKLELRLDATYTALARRERAGIISEFERVETEQNDFEDQVEKLKQRVKNLETARLGIARHWNMYDIAANLGESAAILGKSIDTNPYCEGSDSFLWWCLGWRIHD